MVFTALMATMMVFSGLPASQPPPNLSMPDPPSRDGDDLGSSCTIYTAAMPPSDQDPAEQTSDDPPGQPDEARQTTKGAPEATTGELAPNALTAIDEYTGRNGLGAFVGLGSGIGFSYRRYVLDRLSLRVTGGLFHLRDKVTLYSMGLVSQVDFMHDNRFVLYGVGGLAKSLSRHYSDSGDDETAGIFPSAGVGIELGAHDHIGFTYQFELSLTAIFVDGAYKLLLPLPQVGVYYAF